MILVAAMAFALEPVMVVLPASGGPDEGTVSRTLMEAELERGASVDASQFVEGVEVLVLAEGFSDECAARLPLSEWRRRLTKAQRRFDLFDAAGSVSDLVELELELECLAEPIGASDLFVLDVARAEAHLLLAGVATADVGQATFHQAEARVALSRAVAIAPTKQPDAASPDLLMELDLAREQRDNASGARVAWVAEPGDNVWLNGRMLRGEAVDAVVGDNLLVRERDGQVVAARRVQLQEGQGAIVDIDAGEVDLGELVAGLVRGAPDRMEQSQLAALAQVRSPLPVIYLGWVRREPAVWQVVGQDLVRLPVPSVPRPVRDEESEVAAAPKTVLRPLEPPPRASFAKGPARSVNVWTATAAVGLGGGWRSPEGGFAVTGLDGRVAVGPRWAVAWGIHPEAPFASIDADGEGVAVSVPVTIGGRWGAHTRSLAPEAGLDVGIRAGSAGVATPVLAVCGALSGGAGRAGGVRFEVCVDTDLVGVGVKGGFQVESRI